MSRNIVDDVIKGYPEFARKMDAAIGSMDSVDDVIDAREKEIGEFRLPQDFDPVLTEEDEKVLLEKCEALEDELEARGFIIELDKNAPLKAIYLYVQRVDILTKGIEMSGKWNTIFNLFSLHFVLK